MFQIGQRQVTAFVFVILMIGATIIGDTPDSLLDIITQLVAPIGAVSGIFYYLLKAIQKRVADPTDPFSPGHIFQLFKSGEFVTAIVLSILGLAPMIGIQIPEEQKQIIVTIVLNAVSLFIGVPLMKSYSVRGNKQKAALEPEVKVTVQTSS